MITNFTFDDLILFHYNELNEDVAASLETQLSFDSDLREQSEGISKIKNLLDLEKKKPSETSIRLILDYNRQNSGELELT